MIGKALPSEPEPSGKGAATSFRQLNRTLQDRDNLYERHIDVTSIFIGFSSAVHFLMCTNLIRIDLDLTFHLHYLYYLVQSSRTPSLFRHKSCVHYRLIDG